MRGASNRVEARGVRLLLDKWASLLPGWELVTFSNCVDFDFVMRRGDLTVNVELKVNSFASPQFCFELENPQYRGSSSYKSWVDKGWDLLLWLPLRAPERRLLLSHATLNRVRETEEFARLPVQQAESGTLFKLVPPSALAVRLTSSSAHSRGSIS